MRFYNCAAHPVKGSNGRANNMSKAYQQTRSPLRAVYYLHGLGLCQRMLELGYRPYTGELVGALTLTLTLTVTLTLAPTLTLTLTLILTLTLTLTLCRRARGRGRRVAGSRATGITTKSQRQRCHH